MKEIIELPVDPGYPVAYYDHKREKVFLVMIRMDIIMIICMNMILKLIK